MQAMDGTLQVVTDEPGGLWEARLNWPAAKSLTLLVIDDNQGLIDLFRRYLASFRWQVIGAHNGAEARDVLARALPTVIMLDVMIPDEDGWEVLMSLKSRPDTRDIPVIVCSVLSAQPLAQTLGAAGYLSKPVTQQTLLRALAPWSPDGTRLAPVP
jgi:CheY-like chemotaxis protein